MWGGSPDLWTQKIARPGSQLPGRAIYTWSSQNKCAQGVSDDTAIRKILRDEVISWNTGDADAYSRPFTVDCTFTNVLGMFFKGQKASVTDTKRSSKVRFMGLCSNKNSCRFSLSSRRRHCRNSYWVSGFSSGPPPGTRTDQKGRLRTRLLQAFVKSGSDWKIATYHNVDLKPSTPAPEPTTHAFPRRTSH
jgi:hypothetical protein